MLLAGHAYGGAVITVAGALASNVVGLAYVAAYAVDAGESCLDVAGRFPDSALGPALRPATYPRPPEPPGVELYLKTEAYATVSGDIAVRAATQRPIAASALEERAAAAAWRTLPSRYVVAAADRMLHPTRSASWRAGRSRRRSSSTRRTRSCARTLSRSPRCSSARRS